MRRRRTTALARTRLPAAWAALMVLALLPAHGFAQPRENKIDLGSIMGDGKEDPAAAAMHEGGPGDGKVFNIRTDDNVSGLKKGDIYTNGAKTYFTVQSVQANGTEGGTLVVQRSAGTGSPDRKLNRFSSVDEKEPGPPTIVARQTLLDLYLAGGPFLHPIAILGAVVILLALNSLWVYRTSRQCPKGFIDRATAALEKGDVDGFETLALSERGLLPQVCRAMVDRYDSSTPEDLQKRAEVTAASQINRLRVPVKALNLISAAAPLLGLLGTIVGMVIVFEAVASATGAAKAQALAAGIRVKLFSTAAALCVAIPSLFLYFIFNTKLGNIIAYAEVVSEKFMHQITVLKRREKSDKLAAKKAKEAGKAEGELVGAGALVGAKGATV